MAAKQDLASLTALEGRSFRVTGVVTKTDQTQFGSVWSVNKLRLLSPEGLVFPLSQASWMVPEGVDASPGDRVVAWGRLKRQRSVLSVPHPFVARSDALVGRWQFLVKSPALIERQIGFTPRGVLAGWIDRQAPSESVRNYWRFFLLGLPARHVQKALHPLGLGHLLAVSGLHCGLFYLFLRFFLLRHVPWPWRSLASMVALLGFGLWMGWGPSVSRASVMLLLFEWQRLTHRQKNWFRVWWIVLLGMVLWDPLTLLLKGTWYTFAVSAGLMVAYREWDPLGPRWMAWGRWVLPLVGAQVMALPLNWLFFAEVGGGGFFWNLMALPVLLVLFLLFLTSWATVWNPGLFSFWQGMEDGFLRLLQQGESLTEAATWVRFPPEPLLILILLLSVALLLRLLRREWRWLATALLLSVCLQSHLPLRGPLVAMLNVGQGQTMMVVDDHGQTTLLDVGGKNPYPVSLATSLRLLGGRVNPRGYEVVLSHANLDHTGLLAELPPPKTRFSASETLADCLIHQKDRLPLGLFLGQPLVLEVLWPPKGYRQGTENERSLVSLLRHQDFEWLMTGDAGAATEILWAPRAQSELRLLQVGHHGSRHSSTGHLLHSYRPEEAWISAGQGNSFGHPHAETLARLEAAGARWRSTAKEGTLVFAPKGKVWVCRSLEEWRSN